MRVTPKIQSELYESCLFIDVSWFIPISVLWAVPIIKVLTLEENAVYHTSTDLPCLDKLQINSGKNRLNLHI